MQTSVNDERKIQQKLTPVRFSILLSELKPYQSTLNVLKASMFIDPILLSEKL